MMNAPTTPELQIKGIKDGLLISLGEGSWEDHQIRLFQQIEAQTSFFKGARLALEVGNLELRVVDLGKLRDRLADYDVNLFAILGGSPGTNNAAQLLGLNTRIAQPQQERVLRSLNTQVDGEEAILIQRTLRSGFHVDTRGHIVVIGDVNPGAEIAASGNIIVWGRLCGLAHAGKDGDEDARICALEFAGSTLLIHDHSISIPEKPGKGIAKMAILNDHKIEIRNWEKM